jgi:uncharacterized protein YndB with AHSA1/START domain
MSTLTSVVLTALIEAPPERVWYALTATGTPLPYLHGLTVESDWQPGSTVTMRLDDNWAPHVEVLCGEVLAAAAPRRLSYTLGECPADPFVPPDPSVYVTWQLRFGEGSTVVHLFADEPAPYAGPPTISNLSGCGSFPLWSSTSTAGRPLRWPRDAPGCSARYGFAVTTWLCLRRNGSGGPPPWSMAVPCRSGRDLGRDVAAMRGRVGSRLLRGRGVLQEQGPVAFSARSDSPLRGNQPTSQRRGNAQSEDHRSSFAQIDAHQPRR